ncbi:hypothetical protein SPJ2_1849 [Streptococcus parauberis KRS-02109]|uniref:Uncharacterized protein n=1 Tax=Streptococcus parauberis KRS-02083 TaxID=1207545 RepID=A0ABN0IQC2_9STRE|nr:hypothetical protein SPJ2_1849 [Streptococcus parauberis KRS-02109]EMG25024.1 hypothetical protein SPJ1_1472 [Streptococcus parauberis KRS-02083]
MVTILVLLGTIVNENSLFFSKILIFFMKMITFLSPCMPFLLDE